MTQFNVFGESRSTYAVAPLPLLIEHARARANGRPIVDLYLDATAAVYAMLVPASHGYGVSDALSAQVAERVQVVTARIGSEAPGLIAVIDRNVGFATSLHAQRVAWLREAAETPERVFYSADQDALDGNPNPVWFLAVLNEVRSMSGAALSAIAYERALAWRVIREVGGFPTPDDLELAMADLQRG